MASLLVLFTLVGLLLDEPNGISEFVGDEDDMAAGPSRPIQFPRFCTSHLTHCSQHNSVDKFPCQKRHVAHSARLAKSKRGCDSQWCTAMAL